jgi:hypothetical protein
MERLVHLLVENPRLFNPEELPCCLRSFHALLLDEVHRRDHRHQDPAQCSTLRRMARP